MKPTCKIVSTPKFAVIVDPLSKRPLGQWGFPPPKAPFNYIPLVACKRPDSVKRGKVGEGEKERRTIR